MMKTAAGKGIRPLIANELIKITKQISVRIFLIIFAALLIIISAAVSCAQPEDTRPSRGGDVLPSGQENASSEEVPVRTEAPGTDEPSPSEGTASQSEPGTYMPQTDDTFSFRWS